MMAMLGRYGQTLDIICGLWVRCKRDLSRHPWLLGGLQCSSQNPGGFYSGGHLTAPEQYHELNMALGSLGGHP